MDNRKKNKDLTISDFKALKILLANKEDILNWSYGEITKPETINYRTLRPEKDGLFDERIFGPTKDWECYCGKYKRIRYKGIICDKCGVEVTLSRVRRERMGHLGLAFPVVHVWFFKGSSSPLSIILDVSQKNLYSVIYYASYLVIDVDEEKKKHALDVLSKSMENRVKQQEEETKKEEKTIEDEAEKKTKEVKEGKMSKERQSLVISEVGLFERQKIASLLERAENEKKKINEVGDALTKLIKSLKISSVLSEDEYFKFLEYDIPIFFEMKTGAEALLDVMQKIDINALIFSLRKEAEKSTGAKYLKIVKRLKLLESLKKAGISPASMVMTVLPVIPPDLRPMVQLVGGRFATSDLNDLYRRVINRNNRLKHLLALGAPEIILRNEKRMLQEAVDSLIDAPQRTGQVVVSPLRSLSDLLRGKQGRFRQNLLGKRVDYSGRSVIVVGPELALSQCGLPKDMALEMFKPFVLKEVIGRNLAPNIKSAKRYIEKRPPEVFDILEEITKNHPVLLNRAPTLHKLGIQAFYPVLIEGSAIRLHPCVCSGYNADFDGDQMAVHIPLSQKAQEESIQLMMPRHNLLKPADGSPITLPNKEMAVGIYYLTTIDKSGTKGESPIFSDQNEALLAYSSEKISIRQSIKVRIPARHDLPARQSPDGSSRMADGQGIAGGGKELIETSVGRILFNEKLPESLRFINKAVKASGIKQIIVEAAKISNDLEIEKLIDSIKSLGFYGATISGISVSVFDNKMIPQKDKLIEEAEKKITTIEEEYQQGLITIDEKKRLSNEVWLKTTDHIADLTWDSLDSQNTIRMIIDSEGTRAGKDQLKQLSAMRGLILDPLGKIVELPIKSNFREGLSIFEYVASARGSRKGLTDSALKTANAGYLTRRLVDVAHDMIVRADDCGTKEGILLSVDDHRDIAFKERIMGRITLNKITSKKTRKVILEENEEITEEKAGEVVGNQVNEVTVRSPLTCKLKYGMCARCYGLDLSTKKMVEPGVPVGVVAAQSIGEPGTQLTMRVRHFGGVVMSDVTQGLPRVEELFEVRSPKNLSPVSEISGKVSVETAEEGYKIKVKTLRVKPVEEREYFVPLAAELLVNDQDEISAGTALSKGFLDPRDILKIEGLLAAQRYLISEAQKVYESQGIGINDKHFEAIVRKMSDKVIVESIGDTSLVPGDHVTRARFEEINSGIISQGGEPATGRQVVLGITKAALFSDSWLSAASFQETTKILTETALQGAEDRLIGLKENVMIGRLIPVEGKPVDEV